MYKVLFLNKHYEASHLQKTFYSPACERNKTPILETIDLYFDKKAHILEIASGTGQHASFFSSQKPQWTWQPSDQTQESIDAIKVMRSKLKQDNLLNPLSVSTLDRDHKLPKYDGIFCANMIHISPWEATEGLIHIAHKHLKIGAYLILYGPFFSDKIKASESNLEFDRSLKLRNPDWGIRNLEQVTDLAAKHLLKCVTTHSLPANNLCVIFSKH